MDLTPYPLVVRQLLPPDRLCVLGPGTPNEAVRDVLAGLTPASLCAPGLVRQPEFARACLAGLWLHHDFLDESHSLSQEIATLEGSYWHAIMHRREPDPGNSKYWWRKVGSHPIFQQLAQQAPSVGYQFTDPFAFVDFVERVRDTGSAEEETAKKVQELEWRLLFDWCYRRA